MVRIEVGRNCRRRRHAKVTGAEYYALLPPLLELLELLDRLGFPESDIDCEVEIWSLPMPKALLRYTTTLDVAHRGRRAHVWLDMSFDKR
jgi:hypothetical protein